MTSVSEVQPDRQGVQPPGLGDGEPELNAQVEQAGLEHMAGGIPQRLRLVARQVQVQFRQDRDTFVDLASIDRRLPPRDDATPTRPAV